MLEENEGGKRGQNLEMVVGTKGRRIGEGGEEKVVS